MHRVERGEVGFAGHAENVLGALGDELIDQDLAAGPAVGGVCHRGLQDPSPCGGRWPRTPAEGDRAERDGSVERRQRFFVTPRRYRSSYAIVLNERSHLAPPLPLRPSVLAAANVVLAGGRVARQPPHDVERAAEQRRGSL